MYLFQPFELDISTKYTFGNIFDESTTLLLRYIFRFLSYNDPDRLKLIGLDEV